jgi:tetratricopeptide (TPR) repeat protein
MRERTSHIGDCPRTKNSGGSFSQSKLTRNHNQEGKMSESLDDLISKAKSLDRTGHNEEAMSLATQMVEQHPNEMKPWSLRAYLHAGKHDYEQATADLTRAIAINSMEPKLFWDRGRYESLQDHYQSAVSDFGKGLELCDHYKDDYYRESLHFFRAEALIRLARKREALADLEHVREDLKTWTYKLRTKLELLAECEKLPG